MPRQNNFDCLRLFAALLVLISHSFALTRSPEPFIQLGYETGGGIGVAIFFVISGFLVAASVSRRSTADYLASRALRILPALALVTCFETFVIGPAFTVLPLSDYFANAQTWDHLKNVVIFPVRFFLPGVFASLSEPIVNGSLWTLPAECGLYLVLPIIAFCGGLTRRGSVIAFTICAAGFFVATGYFGLAWESQGPLVVQGIGLFAALKLAAFFFAGSALWANRETVPFHSGGAIVCGLLLFATAGTASAQAVYFVCLPYLVLFVALKTPALPMEKIGDLSYGAYLFAFPVQQSVISIFGPAHIGPVRLSLVTIPIVLALAFVSWRLVEQPALRLRKPRESAAVVQMRERAA